MLEILNSLGRVAYNDYLPDLVIDRVIRTIGPVKWIDIYFEPQYSYVGLRDLKINNGTYVPNLNDISVSSKYSDSYDKDKLLFSSGYWSTPYQEPGAVTINFPEPTVIQSVGFTAVASYIPKQWPIFRWSDEDDVVYFWDYNKDFVFGENKEFRFQEGENLIDIDTYDSLLSTYPNTQQLTSNDTSFKLNTTGPTLNSFIFNVNDTRRSMWGTSYRNYFTTDSSIHHVVRHAMPNMDLVNRIHNTRVLAKLGEIHTRSNFISLDRHGYTSRIYTQYSATRLEKLVFFHPDYEYPVTLDPFNWNWQVGIVP